MRPSEPETRVSLLVRLRDTGDVDAWRTFVDLYAPLVYGLGRRHGLQDADAADLTQDVFGTVALAMRSLEYDPRRGRFRGWLYTIARNRLLDFQRRLKLLQRIQGDNVAFALALEEYPAPEKPDPNWDQEYEQRVFAWAAEQVQSSVRPLTWQAFWLTAVEGQTSEQVAHTLGMSLGAIHVARSRVLARLKQIIRPLLEE